MNIDALHSALTSLIVLPEALHWARENLKASDHASQATLEEFLKRAERDLSIAKATLARALGFSPRCWPPELLALDGDGQSYRLAAWTGKRMDLATDSIEPASVETRAHRAKAAAAPRQKEPRVDLFTRSQRERLLQLRDAIIDSITGVAKTNLRERAGIGADASRDDAADAGSDAFDCDLALSLLAQERDALFEIDDALRRIEAGSYGICEISGKPIPRVRLEAIPFARLTVEYQASLERQRRVNRARRSMTRAFEFEGESADAKAENENRRCSTGVADSRNRDESLLLTEP